jgi:hypothetical protein
MAVHPSILVAVLALPLVTGTARCQETRIKRADLPPAVEKTVAAESQGATIRGLSKETEDGNTFYEVELTVNGRNKDILMDAAGMVVEVEEQVEMSALPPAVRAGLLARAGKGKITMVESLTKRGKLVAYEGHVTTNGKRSEIQVGPDGKPLKVEQ